VKCLTLASLYRAETHRRALIGGSRRDSFVFIS
jgi:hypothetical protein